MLDRIKRLFGGESTTERSREKFLSDVLAIVTSHEGVARVKRQPGAFAIDAWVDGKKQALFLDNLYAETREVSPEERLARIKIFIAAMFDQSDDEPWSDAVETFVPALRASTYALQITDESSTTGMIRRPFLPFVDIMVAMDLPTSLRFLSHRASQNGRSQPMTS